MTTSLILRSVSDERDSRRLEARLTGDGDLVIEGQDIGDAVEEHFGVREYEWIWTVKAADIPLLLDVLDPLGTSPMGHSPDILDALRQQFSGENAAGLKSFLDSHHIPHEVWSRMGD